MTLKDPIAPINGGSFTNPHKWFAWYPVTTHDGYAVWLEYVERNYEGAANTSIVEYRRIA